ncbi:MAG TPA: F0F1 ATP synthase subunit epsilon [Rhizobium sp.]|nr:F0F1 ATP synthase subunit epsilon [Rhizobium sp.]
MSTGLHLVISTPATVLVDLDAVRSVRAEDESGSFGILTGHADLLTVLPASVVRWQDHEQRMHYCAQSGGVFTISDGREVRIACRRATVGDDLSRLEEEVEAMRSALVDTGRQSRVQHMRLHANAVRQLARLLGADAGSANRFNPSREEAP